MISKKEWKKSFKNVNGRESNEKEYEEAVFGGLVRNESNKPTSNKKTMLVLGSIIVSLLVLTLGILLTIFFYPTPSNPQKNFANNNSYSSEKESTSITESSNSSALINYSDTSKLSEGEQRQLRELYKTVEEQKSVWHKGMLRDIVSMYVDSNVSYTDSQFQDKYNTDIKWCAEKLENIIDEKLPVNLRGYAEEHFSGGLGLPTFDDIINESRTYYDSGTKTWTFPPSP